MASWTTGTCEVNGINAHYLRTGGNKQPLVLLHGLTANGACWTPLARRLEKDYDIVMPDARGHGNSGAPDYGYRYENLAADVIGLIDALNLASPVVLGHSMGGMTAALVASQTPKGLRGLVLADPTFLSPKRQLEVYKSDVLDQHRQIVSRPRQDHLTDMLQRHSRRSPEIIELCSQARFQTSMNAFDILTPPNPNYRQLIETLNVPTLLIVGEAGSVVTLELAAELARINQLLEVVQIKEAGHALAYDQPERFSAVVQTFCDRVRA